MALGMRIRAGRWSRVGVSGLGLMEVEVVVRPVKAFELSRRGLGSVS